jgi:hypothetical protein
MITQRFRPIGWVVGIAAAIMLLYVIQLRVANERGKLNEVDAEIAILRKDIRRLNTEFNTRASMRQLERWNGADEQLALATPQARQFVASEDAISEIGAERFEGHGVAPPPAMMQASVSHAPEATTVSEPVVQTAGLAPVVKSQTAAKPAPSMLEDKSKPEPRLTAHDRQAQRELSGRPAVHLSSLKTEKLASVTKKSLLDNSTMKLIDKGAKAEANQTKRKSQ